jgi:hypothetical protein
MTHGIAEINSILLPVHQDGLVMKQLINVLWPSQVMDLVQELLANNIADIQETTLTNLNIDAILQHILVISARKVMMKIAHQTEELNAITARIQIQLSYLSVTELIKTIHNANHAQRTLLKAACPKVKPVTAALHHQNSWSAIQRPSLVLLPSRAVLSNRLAMPNADISPHKSFSVPGEV